MCGCDETGPLAGARGLMRDGDYNGALEVIENTSLTTADEKAAAQLMTAQCYVGQSKAKFAAQAIETGLGMKGVSPSITEDLQRMKKVLAKIS